MHTKETNIKNQVHYHDESLVKPKKIEIKNIFIDKKIYKDLVIYFTRYHPDKSITMLNLYYDELVGNIEEDEGNKFLMVDDYTLDKALDTNNKIDIGKLDDNKILIDTDVNCQMTLL